MATNDNSALQQWALPELGHLLPLGQDELKQIVTYVEPLSDAETETHFKQLLGDSAEANQFASHFNERRSYIRKGMSDEKGIPKTPSARPDTNGSIKPSKAAGSLPVNPPAYVPPPGQPPTNGASRSSARHHTNQVIEAGKIRAKDEQQMQNWLQQLQYSYGIYNDDLEPEHETEYAWCTCPIHQYMRAKYQRLPVQDMWSKAVMYPGK